MSVGDSALKYFSKELIEISSHNMPRTNNKYQYAVIYDNRFSEFSNSSNFKFEIYDLIEIYYLKNDKDFIIHGLAGALSKNFGKRFSSEKECITLKENILTIFDYKISSTMYIKNLLTIFLIANVLFSQNVIWETEFDFIKSNSSPRGVDLNQDGIEDIVLSGGVDGLPSPYGAMAINGVNGEILWTKENGNEWFLSAQHFDQNGDFIPDLLFGGRDAELQLIDGSNGNLIWEFWGNEDNPNDYGWYNFYNPQIISDINFNGYEDILCANGGDHSLDAIETDRHRDI